MPGYKHSLTCVVALALLCALAGCAAKSPILPYPAFIQSSELPDSFVASLPGTRAKILSGDAHSGRVAYRLLLPAAWQFSTGATPGKSIQIYVLQGELRLDDVPLRPGGFVYLPAGSLGMKLESKTPTEVLYFVDPPNAAALIRTPLIVNQEQLSWEPEGDTARVAGFDVKLLLHDPATGVSTWLARVAAGFDRPWLRHSAYLEAYLLEGDDLIVECLNAEPVAGEYGPGGYFIRPAGVSSGGPEAGSRSGAVWLLRSQGPMTSAVVPACSNNSLETD